MLTRLRAAFPVGWLDNNLEETISEAHAVENSWKDYDGQPPKKPGRKWILFLILALLAGGFASELKYSWIQSRLFHSLMQGAAFRVEPGESGQIYHLAGGPYDERLGYARIPSMVERLKQAGWQVESQARWSEKMRRMAKVGTYPIFNEKSHGGLTVVDRESVPLYTVRYPRRVYERFEDISPLIVETLAYIENREVLDAGFGHRNPAVEWDRFGKAVLDLGLRQVIPSHGISGGSTLATQLEKIRHSPGGRTGSVTEKARQMTLASLRAYTEGPHTIAARKTTVRNYLNSLPLAATPGFGEVIGLGDGLEGWFQADFDEVNRLLEMEDRDTLGKAQDRRRGGAYRKVLSLLLAINRPFYYLRQNPAALDERVESYLRVLARDGIIDSRLRDLALSSKTSLAPATHVPVKMDPRRKGTDSVRYGLLGLLGLDNTYDLDRLDLKIKTTLDRNASLIAADTLKRLSDEAFLAEAGLVGDRLLASGQGDPVLYTFTLYERGANANLLRVQVDSAPVALNLNEGSKLELGSTAKLRTLVTYLEVIAALHARITKGEDAPLPSGQPDKLTLWAVEYLAANQGATLEQTLNAAMERLYSSSPGESFFTGGGLHVFANFDRDDNGRVISVREAFQRSVNLVFIRIMRDLVDYRMRRLPGYTPALLQDQSHPGRVNYLRKFADQEGSAFLRGYYEKYSGKTPQDQIEALFADRTMNAVRLAVMFRAVRPQATFGEFSLLAHTYLKSSFLEKQLMDVFERYGPEKFDWNDKGYVAGVHPLELWVLEYLNRNPDAGWSEVREASRGVTHEVYRWLFRNRLKHAQDLRIRTVLEAEAFAAIHQAWKRQGYPFRALVPSLATAIGSSGDTPAALAELAGVILAGGIRYTTARVEKLAFAEQTPFEARFSGKKEEPVRVMPVAVAAQLHKEMLGVVEKGTGRRAFRSAVLPDGSLLPIGGKTGTGDNRDKIRGVGERVRNRTATFVFTLGDRYFGTVVAYVPGEQAASYRFTSALPVQVFKTMVPRILPGLHKHTNQPAQLASASTVHSQ
jgi:membrane peptidoglycan carboxypeptidase